METPDKSKKQDEALVSQQVISKKVNGSQLGTDKEADVLQDSPDTKIQLKKVSKNNQIEEQSDNLNQKFEKKQNKLMMNLQSMAQAGLNLSSGIKQQQQDIEEKKKQQMQRQEEQQLDLEAKLSTYVNLKEGTKKELEEKHVTLQIISESTVKQKQELLSLKQLQAQLIEELVHENDEMLREKTQKVKDLGDRIEEVKQRIKKERQRRRELEEKVDELEVQRNVLGMRLNDLGKEAESKKDLNFTTVDFDKEVTQQVRLKEKLQQVKELRFQMIEKNQGYLSESDQLSLRLQQLKELVASKSENSCKRDQLQLKFDQLKTSNKGLFDANLQYLEKLKLLQMSVQMDETKRFELIEIANLLKDQNRFEKFSRRVQIIIESWEDDQRYQEDLFKEIQTNLKFMTSETGTQNEDLQFKLQEFDKCLQGGVKDKDELRDQVKLVMMKVCNKNPSELKIEMIEQYFEQLGSYERQLLEQQEKSNQMKKKIEAAKRQFFEHEKKIKEQLFNETYELMEDNGGLIVKAGEEITETGQRLMQLEAHLKDKASDSEELMEKVEQVKSKIQQARISHKRIKEMVDEERALNKECKDKQEFNKVLLQIPFQEKTSSQSEHSNITEFVSQKKDCKDQNDRLNDMQFQNLKDFRDLLNSLEEDVIKLDESLVGNKVEQCKKLIEEGEKHCDDIEKVIQELDEKLRVLGDNVLKADTEEAREIQKEIEKTKKDVDNLRKLKDQLRRELELIEQQDDQDMIQHQKHIKDILGQLQKLQNKDLKEKEKEVDAIEAKLRNAIRKRRSNKRKECQDELEQAKANMVALVNLLDKLKHRIEDVNKNAQVLEKTYQYKDQERDQEIELKLNTPISDNKRDYQVLEEERESLKGLIDTLKKEYEEMSQKLIESQTITAQSDKDDGNQGKDDVIQKWTEWLDKAKEVENEINKTVQKVQQQSDQVDTLQQVHGEMSDKYKNKNQLYKECLQKQKEKQATLNDQLQNLNKIEKNIESIEQLLEKIVKPSDLETNYQFISDYNDKLMDIAQLKDKLQKDKLKHKSLEEKLSQICHLLPLLGDEKVQIKDLTEIKTELDRLDLETSHLKDEIKGLDWECEEAGAASKTVFDEDKKILLKDAEESHEALVNDLANLDQLYKETADKLHQYNLRINDGLYSEDQDLRSQLKILSEESQEIEKELKQQERLKNNLKAQEKFHREQLLQLKINLKKSMSPEEFQTLTQNFKKIGVQSIDIKNELEKIKLDIDTRLNEIEDFMSKYSEMQGLYSEFDNMMNDFKRNNRKFLTKVDESKNIAELLEIVLREMQKGVGADYKLKETFINQELEEMEDIKSNLAQLEKTKVNLEPKMKAVQSTSNQQLDADGLQQLITDTMELIEELENADNIASSCHSRLRQIKIDIGDADVPELTKQREQEVVEFSAKLRKVEQDFAELKKQIGSTKGVETYNDVDVDQELRAVDVKLAVFKEDRQKFKRILGQDLLIYLPQPKALEDLHTLKIVVGKLRELGESVNMSIDKLEQLLLLAFRLRRQIGGLDLMKRHNEMKFAEEDQRKRLEAIKGRLERISKGASDCDGYTSNTEEATFIETLLSEIPEMKQKQSEAFQECDAIQDSLFGIKQIIEQIARNDSDESATGEVNSHLESVEEQTNLNERTVTFLEKLIDKLEEHFLQMDVKKKLEKRQMELKELHNICQDFEEQLTDMHHHILKDMTKIDDRKKFGQGLQDMLVDEEGNPVNLLEEISNVQNELQEILFGVIELQDRNKEIQDRRNEAESEFQDQILRKSPFKGQGKITNKHDVFSLLRANGWMKKKIVDMIKTLKDVSRRMRESKHKYQVVRTKIEKHNKPKKLYRAIRGDMVDELFADYINKLNCPVPIKRLGNNQYTFGTRKIFAKVINGKLVIRVGGGYMSIEEFMMYYGPQELTRIQKQEYLHSEENDQGLLSATDTLSDGGEEEARETGRKSNANLVDIETLKKRLRDQSGKKKIKRDQFFGEEEEEKSSKMKSTTVLGIGDVRKALKNNMVEIKTYQEHSSVGHSGFDHASKSQMSAKKVVKAEKEMLEKQLKSMEKNIGNKLKASQVKDMTSPKRPSSNISKASNYKSQNMVQKEIEDPIANEPIDGAAEIKSTKRTLFVGQSKIPQIRKTVAKTPLEDA